MKFTRLCSNPKKRSLIRLLLLSFVVLLPLSFLFAGFSENRLEEGFPEQEKKWIGTWATAPQLVEPRNMPPQPGLSNNTLRQVVAVSIGGEQMRLKLSNEFSDKPVEIRSLSIAASEGGSAVDESTMKELNFDGRRAVTIEPGGTVTSDPVSFDLEPRMRLAITASFGNTPQNLTGHPGSRTTSYLVPGNENLQESEFKEAVETDHWYITNGIDVLASESAGAVAILGNSITDGRGSGTNEQNRWPDILSKRLLKNQETRNVGVLNMGIGGNAVLKGGLGPTGLERFERDILNQNGVRWLIIMEGVNDLGAAKDGAAAFQVANDLIAAYEKMIDQAHAEDIKAYGGTITPIAKSFYYTPFREDARRYVNEWIRNSGRFDAVIDFDRAIRNPEEESTISPAAHSGDYLHPNELGYQMMGESIDLSLFHPEPKE